MRCLVVRSAFLGDICLGTASLRGIKKKHPDAKTTFVCWPSCSDLLSLNPYVDALATAGKYFVSDFTGGHVDFRHEAKMPRFKGDNDPLLYWGAVHAHQAADAGLLDIDMMESYRPELFVGPGDLVDTSDLGDFVAINVFTQNGVGWRLWDFDKWERLVAELHKKGLKVVQLGGLGDPKVRGVDVQLCGKTKLAQSISVVASASIVIGIDSFIMHCAHATKSINNVETDEITEISGSTKAILLAGPIHPSCVIPTDANCVPVSTYPDCNGPCGHSHAKSAGMRICEHSNSCMKNITIEQVLGGVDEFRKHHSQSTS